ncbi:MAG: PEP-CTERM sorting domain-containing protein [Sedimentisphaerales bacterium]|nr:PEP-CTERM sorting domain-containing protein [Sedimentisphaerales bacterium]
MKKLKPCVVALALIAALAVANQAVGEVLYYDNFDGLTGVDLDGLAPDISMGGAVWDAGPEMDADGAITYSGTVYGDSAYLPFTPESGYIYTLSVTMNATVGDWLGVGFTQNKNPAERFLEEGVYWWALTRSEGHAQTDQTFIGVRTNGAQNASTSGADNIVTVIDTTGVTWGIEWFFDGNVERSEDIVDPGVINYVAFSNARCDGVISEFSLTRIPEPATLAILGLGSVLAVRRRRR